MSSDKRDEIKPLLAPMFVHPSEDPDTGQGFLRSYPPMVLVLKEIRPPFEWFDYRSASVDEYVSWRLRVRYASRIIMIDGAYKGPTEYAFFRQEGVGNSTVSPGI